MHSLYMIYGEEDLTRFEALDSLRAAAKTAGSTVRELFTAEGAFNWQSIDESLDSPGLFAAEKLIEIHIPGGKPGRSGGDYLAALPGKLHKRPHNTVIIFLPRLEKAALQSKWFRELKKHAEITEARALPRQSLPRWLQQRLAQFNLKITEEAACLFADRVEGNLLATRQEIEKLALLYPPQTVLGIKEIEEVIVEVARFDFLQLTAAWMQGDLSRLVKLLSALHQQDFEPTLLIWLLSEDIRTLIRLMGASRQGKDISSLRYELRLWGDKLAYSTAAVQRLKITDLICALQKCAVIDRQLKGVEDGNAWDGIKNILTALAQ